ncbi:MAG: hypothetical protein U9R79_12450 [Armatimonadota bacterium]|nr:hypothetical protein [Armatimonadota bacterium]
MGVLALLAAAAWPADEHWRRLSCPAPGFSVEAPDGWELVAVQGRGARLVPPDTGPIVEVVAWDALRNPATPEKAAVEHEGVLGRVVDYRRDSMEEIETEDGRTAMVVVGRVRSRGVHQTSIFAAYASEGKHWVLGTFTSRERLAELRRELLDRMMRSFRPGPAGAAPEPAPPVPEPEVEPDEPELAAPGAPEPAPAEDAEPPEPEEAAPEGETEQPEAEIPRPPEPPEREPEEEVPAPPDEGGPATGAAPTEGSGASPETSRLEAEVEGATPTVGEPEMGATTWIRRVDPHGFVVSIPADWSIRVLEGVIVIEPADRRPGALYMWPLMGVRASGSTLEELVRRLPGLDLAGTSLAADVAGTTAFLDAVTAGDMRLLATLTSDGRDGLLVAAAAADPDRLEALRRVAASFRPGVWLVPEVGEQPVTGEAAALTWRLPERWEARGGLREEGGDLSIEIDGMESGASGMHVAWHQPIMPRFRALTPLLESLGWREGERYSAPDAGRALMIYRRREPDAMVRELLLARHPRSLDDAEVEAGPPSSAIAGLLTGAEAAGQHVLVRGSSAAGRRERLYVAATARAPVPVAATCWEGAVLRADAPEGKLPTAAAVLVRMVRSATPTQAGLARHGERLKSLLERARRAVGAIPEELVGEIPMGEARSVLDAGDVEGDRTWTMPPEALEPWTESASG